MMPTTTSAPGSRPQLPHHGASPSDRNDAALFRSPNEDVHPAPSGSAADAGPLPLEMSEHMRNMLEMQYEQQEYTMIEPDQHAASSGILPPPLSHSGSDDDPATRKSRRRQQQKQQQKKSTASHEETHGGAAPRISHAANDRWSSLSSFSTPPDTATPTKTPFNSVRDVGVVEQGQDDDGNDDNDEISYGNHGCNDDRGNAMPRMINPSMEEAGAELWLKEVSQRHHLSAACSSNTPVSSGSPMTTSAVDVNDVDPTVGHGTLLVNPRRLLRNQRHDSGLPRSPLLPNAVLPMPTSPSPSEMSSPPPQVPLVSDPPTLGDDGQVDNDELDFDLGVTPKQTNLSGFSPLLTDVEGPVAAPRGAAMKMTLTKSVGRHMNLASYGTILGNGGSAPNLSSLSLGESLANPSSVLIGTDATATTTDTAGSSSRGPDASSLYLYDDKSYEPQEYLLLRNQQHQPPSSTSRRYGPDDGRDHDGLDDGHSYYSKFEPPSSYQHAHNPGANHPNAPKRVASWSWSSSSPPPDGPAPPDKAAPSLATRRRTAAGRWGLGSCCCCGGGSVCCRACYMCLGYYIGSALRYVAGAESLHRSFCYGAIDGVLTGSGIVATFCGLGLVERSSDLPVRQLLVVFSLCAGLSDSVGMAIGHVWTTHVAAAAQARDRSAARANFQKAKHTAKGQLVDMLLGRGMLKIDAMSLADTLEGYPDLFVAALAGESLVGDASPAPSPANRPSSSASSDVHPAVLEAMDHDPFDPASALDSGYASPSSSSSPPTQYGHHIAAYLQPRPPPPLPPPPRPVLSYGRLSDYDMDPDAYGVLLATKESRLESICMMVSFTVFAVLPALVLNQAWSWSDQGGAASASTSAGHQPRSMTSAVEHSGTYSGMNTVGESGAVAGNHLTSLDPTASSPVISPLSLAMSVGACLMWCLGVWKSRFLDRTYWIWFGVETVVVFGLCLLTAFGLGALLRSVLLKDSMYVIATSASHDNDDFW